MHLRLVSEEFTKVNFNKYASKMGVLSNAIYLKKPITATFATGNKKPKYLRSRIGRENLLSLVTAIIGINLKKSS